MSNDGWLNLSLTISQEFELEHMKRMVTYLDRQKLEQIALQAIEQSYRYQNAMKSLMKEKL